MSTVPIPLTPERIARRVVLTAFLRAHEATPSNDEPDYGTDECESALTVYLRVHRQVDLVGNARDAAYAQIVADLQRLINARDLAQAWFDMMEAMAHNGLRGFDHRNPAVRATLNSAEAAATAAYSHLLTEYDMHEATGGLKGRAERHRTTCKFCIDRAR